MFWEVYTGPECSICGEPMRLTANGNAYICDSPKHPEVMEMHYHAGPTPEFCHIYSDLASGRDRTVVMAHAGRRLGRNVRNDALGRENDTRAV